MKKNQIKNALGRGLESLLPSGIGDDIFDEVSKDEARIVELDIELIKPNAFQPRKNFSKAEIEELTSSIERYGVLQPLLVRKMGNSYEIIAGERRWRASKNCKLKKVPVIILDIDEERRLEISLVENIQRTDLNPIEEAYAYKTLIDKYSLTQEEVGKRMGKSRTYITNLIRLLSMSDKLQDDIVNKRISVGHAKVLASLSKKEQEHYAEIIKDKQLNVRELEEELRKKNKQTDKKSSAKSMRTESEYDGIAEELADIFKSRVYVRENNHKGHIAIEFYDMEDFNRIYEILKKK